MAPSVKSEDVYTYINEAGIQEQMPPYSDVVTPEHDISGGEATHVNETETEEGYERLRGRHQKTT